MKVTDIMTREVQTCTVDTSLPQVARLMWAGCCGIIPVIDARGRVVGVVTDRDISIELVNTTRKPINVAAHEVMSRRVHACGPEDDLQRALQTMRQYKVRRLPVIDQDGRMKGMLSMDDIIVRALAADAPTSEEIVQALRDILVRPEPDPEFAFETSL